VFFGKQWTALDGEETMCRRFGLHLLEGFVDMFGT
jgi:hypothetical protein